MKKLFFLLGLSLLSFSACYPGYVSQEPTYVTVVRPARPSDRHVWRDNEWVYRRRTKVYVPRDGYWVAPHKGRTTYKPGHWKSNKRGHYWVKGRWQK